ncbi:WD repeat-containing protein 75 [Gastrophryne carolinensis]
MVVEEEIQVVRSGGSRINDRRPLFSVDGKYILFTSGDFIKVFSTATQECIHVLQGHSAVVTGIALNPKNHLQLYSCSLDGTVKLWDFMDGILIKDEYIAAVKGLNLWVYYFKSQKSLRFTLHATSKNGANNMFTVVKCHPKEDCIATGHEDGKIRLWRNFNHKQEYTFSTLHWHHDAVLDLAFSVQGTVLLSGGIESVLVQWSFSLEHKKEFLPRLGAAIEHISTSPDGSLHCTSHKDNKITIIDVGLKVKGIIQGLVKGTDIKTGLLFDPRSKALVLNGKPGHLQFYSLHDDKQLYNLDIVQQEFVHQSGLQYMDLVKAAFSSKGNWLATIEELQGNGVNTLDMQMKLWEFNDQLQSFVLNTTISMPHEERITSLVFQKGGGAEKDSQTLVTTGSDGLFKVWILRDNSDIYRQSFGWSCDFVGTYHRNQATDCCFSEDGSLLAVAFEEIVTIWETSNWDLKHTFCQPPGKIRSLCFGRFSCLKYLLASTDRGFLNCWDLLACALTWRAQIDVALLQPDVLTENIAAFSYATATGNSNLFIFNPSDPMPLYVHENICLGTVQCALFVPRPVPETIPSRHHRWLIRSQLYFVTENQDLLTFSTKSPEERLKPLRKQNSATSYPQNSTGRNSSHPGSYVLDENSVVCTVEKNSEEGSLAASRSSEHNSSGQNYASKSFKTSIDSMDFERSLLKLNKLEKGKVATVLEFLQEGFKKGLAVSSLKTQTSTLSVFLEQKRRQNELANRFFKSWMLEENLPFTPFYTLFGKNQREKRDMLHMDSDRDLSTQTSTCHTFQAAAIKELLHTPAHVLPPTSVLCAVFVNSLLISKQSKCAELVTGNIEMESEDENGDEELDVKEDETTATLNTSFRQYRSQENKLRYIRKKDFSWIRSAL